MYSCSDSRCLKLVREIKVSNFSDFCNSFQAQAAENWKERRPNEVLALGMNALQHLAVPFCELVAYYFATEPLLLLDISTSQ